MSRTTSDTTYNVRTDVVETETGLTTEEGALYTYNGELKAHLGGSTVTVYPQSSGSSSTTTTVNISSAQILAMGSTPIELLPAPGANKYYDIEKIILEYTHVSTAYSLPFSLFLYVDTYVGPAVVKDIITTASSKAVILAGSGMKYGYADDNVTTYEAPLTFLNNPVVLKVNDGENPTLGDGTMRAIITYNLRTFGA